MGTKDIGERQIQPTVASLLAGVRWGQKFIAERAFAPVDVGGEEFEYETYDNSGLEDPGDDARAMGGATPEVDLPKGSKKSDKLEEYARYAKLDYRQLNAARTADKIRPMVGGMSREERLRFRAAKRVQHNLEILKEKKVAAIAFGASNYDSDLQITNVNFATADLIDIFYRDKTIVNRRWAVAPDTLIVGELTWRLILKNTTILDRVTGGANNISPAEVNQKLVAQLLGLQQILVGTAITQTKADPGERGTPTVLWTDDAAALVYSGVSGFDEFGDPLFEDTDESTQEFGKLFYMNVPETGVRYDVRTYDLFNNGKVEAVEGTEFHLAKKICPCGVHYANTDQV